MIYLVKNKMYDGVPYTVNSNILELLKSKGAGYGWQAIYEKLISEGYYK